MQQMGKNWRIKDDNFGVAVICLENNDCVTCVFMVCFNIKGCCCFGLRIFFSRGAQPERQFRMTKTTTDDFQTKQ